MKEKRDCKIIQDLLPNYIEKLTNEETNNYIEEHLKDCRECRKILKDMQRELKINDLKRDDRKVKYIKKYNKKLLILKLTICIILAISLGVMTYGHLYYRNAFFRLTNKLSEEVSEQKYPDVFYATITEISDSEIYGVKEVTVKGLNINDKNHRGEYYFSVYLDNIEDVLKIKWNETDINFEQIKVGQTVAIYNYGDILEPEHSNLSGVRKIIVLDEKI